MADDHLFHTDTVGWLPDGKAFVFVGFESGHLPRVYVEGVDGQAPRPVTPEGVVLAELSSDGKQLAAFTASGELVVYPLDGGQPRTIPGTRGKEPIIGWGRDGKSVIIRETSREVSAILIRLDIATGKRQLWKTITPEETSGAFSMAPVLIGSDENSYVYGINRRLTDLYVVEGLK